MTWDKFLNGEIHIDHIYPCSSFDLTDPEQQKACFHWSNCQPLWVKDNLIKGDTIPQFSELPKYLRDEAAAKGDTKAIDTLDEHLEYRMGKDGSFWQKQQLKTEVQLGLIDPKGEAELTAPKS